MWTMRYALLGDHAKGLREWLLLLDLSGIAIHPSEDQLSDKSVLRRHSRILPHPIIIETGVVLEIGAEAQPDQPQSDGVLV